MDADDSGKMGFQPRVGSSGGGGGGVDSSEAMFKTPSGGLDPFYNSSGWDQLVSLHHSGTFGGVSSVGPHNEFVVLENQAINVVSSHMVQHYPSDSSGLVDMVPKLPSFGSGSFSEMVTSFGLPECGQITETICHQSYSQNKEGSNEKALKRGTHSQDNYQIAEEGAANSSPSGKRKRKASEYHSPFNPNKSVEGDPSKVPSRESSECSKEQDEMKAKIELGNSANPRSKHGGKQTNNSNSGEPNKDDYIHVRAKRGQATNSHSLAERVRRERISERMRLLQELVPGCNKITGKAMMLDEIINYVQSLQQQVEFLSMKLATVNPELNVDIERLLSKDILHSRGASVATLAIPPGLNTSHPFPGIPQGTFPGIPNITPPFHPMPQAVWDNELQNLLQMGFDSNPSVNNLGPNGR